MPEIEGQGLSSTQVELTRCLRRQADTVPHASAYMGPGQTRGRLHLVNVMKFSGMPQTLLPLSMTYDRVGLMTSESR